MSGKKPTHVLKVKEREGNGKTTIGVGWLNDDGSMSISLHGSGERLDQSGAAVVNKPAAHGVGYEE